MARALSGTSQSLQHAAQVVANVPFTTAGWLYRTATGVSHTILSIGISGTVNSRSMLIVSSTDKLSATTTNTGGASSSASSVASVSSSVWNHGAAVFAAANSRIVYLNGTAASETTSRTCDDSSDVLIGARQGAAPSNFWPGRLAEQAIWNVALTQAEITQLSLGVSPLLIRPASLVTYWPLFGNNDPEQDIVGGFGATNTGTTKAVDHPRVFYPSRQQLIFAPAAPQVTTVDPVSLTFTPVVPATKKITTVAPVVLTFTPVAPNPQIVTTVAPVAMTFAPVLPATRKVSTVAPATFSLTALAPLARKITTPTPAQLTFSAVSPAARKITTVSPVVLTFTATVPTQPLQVPSIPGAEYRMSSRRLHYRMTEE